MVDGRTKDKGPTNTCMAAPERHPGLEVGPISKSRREPAVIQTTVRTTESRQASGELPWRSSRHESRRLRR